MNAQSFQKNSVKLATPGYQDAICRLAAGDLDPGDRQTLLAQILKDPAAASEAKLALRLRDESIKMASTIVQRAEALASTKRSYTWGFRALAGGTCAGLLMLFAMPNVQNSAPERSVAAISVSPELSDQMMSSSGFEAAHSDFGGSFE